MSLSARVRCGCGVACLVLFLAATTSAEDWPQWRGPRRDGVWNEAGVVTEVPADGLAVNWRVPIGLGYAGPAVVDRRVYVLDYDLQSGEVAENPGKRDELQGDERLLCLDADSGQVVWTHRYEQPYQISYGSGPRTTPVIEGGHVYLLGAEGKLWCLTAATGDVVWSHDLKSEYEAPTPYWGHSAHPLVYGELLISLVGGPGSAVVAFDKRSGKEAWRALSSREVGYCPPTVAAGLERPQLLIWLPDAVHGLDPATGAVLWSVELKPDFGMSIAAPAIQGRHAFLSGVGNQSVLLELSVDGGPPRELWRGDSDRSVSCSHSSPLIVDDMIYGCDDKGWLRGVDLTSGERLWETLEATTRERPASYGTAFLVRGAERWFLFNDQGDLVIADLDRAGYHEHGRFHVLEPTGSAFGRPVVWSHPAFAGGRMYARNDKELVCVSLTPR